MRKLRDLALVFYLGLCLTSASVRAGEAEDKAPESALQRNLDVYLGQLKRGSVEKRREAVQALGRMFKDIEHLWRHETASKATLAKRLKDASADTRRYAAEDLWRFDKASGLWKSTKGKVFRPSQEQQYP